MQLRSIIIGGVLSVLAVITLQPLYFLAMANLDHIISHDAMRSHFREAFMTGVLSAEAYPTNHLFTSGDRFTDCIALSVGMKPGDSPLISGIVAPFPTPSRHPCEHLQEFASDPASVTIWQPYYRYWHGYRIYYAPLASVLPIYAVKLVNLALLLLAFTIFCWRSIALIGVAATIGLAAPIVLLTDFLRVWQVTPHAIGVVFILGGAALFGAAIRRLPDFLLLIIAAVLGSIFNFIDFLVNPPWQPMLLAFFVMSGMVDRKPGQRFTIAALIVLSWFGGYGLTWFAKWVIAYFAATGFDVMSDVTSTVAFRLRGEHEMVRGLLFAATYKVVKSATLSWGLPFFIVLLVILFRFIRQASFRWQPFWHLAWTALIPVFWFEVLSNHSQIHAVASSRSAAASCGVLLASALVASGAKSITISRMRIAIV